MLVWLMLSVLRMWLVGCRCGLTAEVIVRLWWTVCCRCRWIVVGEFDCRLMLVWLLFFVLYMWLMAVAGLCCCWLVVGQLRRLRSQGGCCSFPGQAEDGMAGRRCWVVPAAQGGVHSHRVHHYPQDRGTGVEWLWSQSYLAPLAGPAVLWPVLGRDGGCLGRC